MAAPCAWTGLDTGCCDDFWSTLTPAEQDSAAAAASYVLWAATGRRFGLCPVTVRPCGRTPCNDNIGGYFWSWGVWQPYIVNGLWYNCVCGDLCTCGARCRLYLPGPVASISSVTLDGNLVDPSTYRVDDGRWLVRTGDGNCWPESQNFDRDSGDGTLIVSYTRGEPVPAILLNAAGRYACEWAKSCQGLPCQLPGHVVSLTRQGTTFQNTDLDLILQRGLTGIPSVDQVIMAINPNALTHRMRLLSPDLPGPVMTTWP